MAKIAYIDKKISPARLEIIDLANQIIENFQRQGYKLTLRQLFYQFVSKDWIKNTQREYKRLGDIITDGRMTGLIDWEAIADNLRKVKKVNTWDSPEEILEAVAEQFKLDLWEDQEFRPEVWVEKDALSEVVVKAAHRLRVPVMVCRGYMSISAMWESGEKRFRRHLNEGQTPLIIHLGDHDPSGLDMTRDIEDRMTMFTGVAVKVERIALNMSQIEEYNPPPNYAKVTDSRADEYIAHYGDESWELDALEPKVLDDLITDAINEYRDVEAYDKLKDKEEEHKTTLMRIAEEYDDVKDWLDSQYEE